MDDLDTPKFVLSDACRASRIEPNTVRAWLSREHLTLGANDLRAAQNGKAHTISLRRVYQIAITAELVGMGVGPRRAARLAAGFSDVGNGSDPDSQGHERLPGHLYDGAYTWLICPASDSKSRVLRVTPDRLALDVVRSLQEGALVLPLDAVLRRVDHALVRT